MGVELGVGWGGWFCCFSNTILHRWSRRHHTAVCQGISDARPACSLSFYCAVESLDPSLRNKTRANKCGLHRSTYCTFTAAVPHPDVWWSLDKYRLAHTATFCKHFPYHNLNFIINSHSNRPVKKPPCSTINKTAPAEHDSCAFSSAGRLWIVNVSYSEDKYSDPSLKHDGTFILLWQVNYWGEVSRLRSDFQEKEGYWCFDLEAK